MHMVERLRTGLALAVVGFAAVLVGVPLVATSASAATSSLAAVPVAQCGPGSSPETGLQGRVSQADIDSGRAAQGYRCNTTLVGEELTGVPLGTFGGFKVLRYIDPAGHECAFYDLQLLVGTGIADISKGLNAGIGVLDMSDPTHPVRTATLSSIAMLSPHESLQVSPANGLLVAVAGTPLFGPGVVDVYDLKRDCRHPALLSLPNLAGVIGHESGMAPDGRTFYSGNPAPGGEVAAVDLTDPSHPTTLATIQHPSHGITISQDGNTAYLTSLFPATITIMDVSQINHRVPNPQTRVIGSLSWPGTIPQIALPVTIGGHPYLVEVDEYGALGSLAFAGAQISPGAARIIDIGDPANPKIISNIRLQVHDPANFAALQGDSGSANPVGGYAGHYCNVPSRTDPGILACSMASSGLRLFDIRDPYHPREAAYFNQPAAITPNLGEYGIPPSWAQSSPAFAPERCEVWYSDGRTGFYDVRLTNGVCDLLTSPASATATTAAAGGKLPATGSTTTTAAPTLPSAGAASALPTTPLNPAASRSRLSSPNSGLSSVAIWATTLAVAVLGVVALALALRVRARR